MTRRATQNRNVGRLEHGKGMSSFGQFVCEYGHVVPLWPGVTFLMCPVCAEMCRQRVKWAYLRLWVDK
jgi:hypothetical protein